MADAAIATTGGAALDAAQLKKEIGEVVSATTASLKATLLSEIKAHLDGRDAAAAELTKKKPDSKKAAAVSGEDLADLQDEMKALDIDDKTAGALTSMMSKILAKKSGSLKDEVKNEIETTGKTKEVKQGWDALAIKNFPQLAEKGSVLATEATKIYQNNLSAQCKNSPEGSLVAVMIASLMTGERPVTLEELKRIQSQNEGNGNSGGGANDNAVDTTKVDALAKGFGLDPAKVQAKLKLIKSKQMFK